MIGLTHQQAECLDFIRARSARGCAPSYEEIRVGLGLASKNGVFRLLNALEKRGRIRRLPRQARAIEIIEAPDTSAFMTMSQEELGRLIAQAAGVYDYRFGGSAPIEAVLSRIGARLSGRPIAEARS